MARRIVPARRAGLNRKAPFWKGDTAEKVLARRLADRAAEAESKRNARAAKRGKKSRGSSSRPAVQVPANKRLRRLYRALTRRKTLAARQRVQARIKALEKELGL